MAGATVGFQEWFDDGLELALQCGQSCRLLRRSGSRAQQVPAGNQDDQRKSGTHERHIGEKVWTAGMIAQASRRRPLRDGFSAFCGLAWWCLGAPADASGAAGSGKQDCP
ncbi:MAG: hypothetical protein CMJ75_10390 [Planctomycetaceae bacterium]|nr:hypothetical protein [Planctomycetaceae bacterium]